MTTAKPSRINLNGWTDERRKTQSKAIHRWKPWLQSTGAKTIKGKEKVAQNAFKGGYGTQLRQLKVELNRIMRAQNELLNKLNN